MPLDKAAKALQLPKDLSNTDILALHALVNTEGDMATKLLAACKTILEQHEKARRMPFAA
ncbi:MAG: hypothetical protein JSS66_05655 [Armatimonadetes bacterium]|nr:hypothetical protein [Armatimonadota bacterium]